MGKANINKPQSLIIPAKQNLRVQGLEIMPVEG